MKRESLSLQQLFTILFIGFVLLFAISAVAAWTGPTGTPPNDNVAAPINVGSTDQVKDGGVGVDALAVFGNTILGGSQGSNAYLNFGAIPTPSDPSTGYGFRDDNGVMQYKDANGVWTSFDSLASNNSNGGGGGGTIISNNSSNTYNVPGTQVWTKPAAGTTAVAQCWGAGGAGGGIGGGGGGGYVSSSISLSQLPATVTVTVGRSGHLPTYNTNGIESAPATNGGTSSFGSFAIAYGGTSFDNAPTPPRFVQATAAGGSYQGTTGENGGTGDSQSAGGSTTCAGAGGGSGGGAGSSGTSGGSSGCGGNGGGGGFGGGIATDAGDTQGQSGSPGSAPGGGGGGGGNNGGDNGGSGGSGECIITVN